MKRFFSLFAISAVVLGMASCGGNDGNEPASPYVVNPNSENGMMPGFFTVDADGTQVHFSQGNLQYNDSADVWIFAANQWDTLGIANKQIGKEDYKGWIDLFGWSTGKKPTEASTTDTDYKEPFVDWGKKNAIANGGNNVGAWRTLRQDEWVYICFKRENAAHLFGLGSVNGVNGVILLPDEWKMPTGVPTFKPSIDEGMADYGTYYNDNRVGANRFVDNTYNAAQWDVLEKAGAIFLPAAGWRLGTNISSIGSYGGYWSTASNGASEAGGMFFDATYLGMSSGSPRSYGRSVRLVR